MHSQSIGSANPVGGRGADHAPAGTTAGPPHAKGDSTPGAAADAFRFAPGRDATLRLMRERVLARTRCLLDLPPCALPARFAESAEIAVPDFVGRLWAEQNQMAAPRLQTMARAEMREFMSLSFRLGAQETLELLQDAGCLDAAGTELIAHVLVAFEARMAEPGHGDGPDA